MIIYATKKMLDIYKLNTPDEMISEISPLAKKLREIEKDNSLYQWGCKLDVYHIFDRVTGGNMI